MVFALVERLSGRNKNKVTTSDTVNHGLDASREVTPETDETDETDKAENQATTTEEQSAAKYPIVYKKYSAIYDSIVRAVSGDNQSVTIEYWLRRDGVKTTTHELVLNTTNCSPKTLVSLIRSGEGSQPILTLGEAVFRPDEGKTLGVISSNMDFLALSTSLRDGN